MLQTSNLSSTHHVHHLESFQQFAVAVLQAVGLVDDHTPPGDAAQLGTVGEDHLKGGDDGVEPVGPFDDFILRGQILRMKN